MGNIETAVMAGDLSKLTPEEKEQHYLNVCSDLGINFKTRPLAYFNTVDFNGASKLILYALKNATDQLRVVHKIKITKMTSIVADGVVTYTVEGENGDGLTDISTGSVSVQGKAGVEKANAMMAAETKAKRRVTLSLSGAGLLDESEIADMNAPTSMPAGAGVSVATRVTPSTNNAVAKEVVEVKAEVAGNKTKLTVASTGEKLPAGEHTVKITEVVEKKKEEPKVAEIVETKSVEVAENVYPFTTEPAFTLTAETANTDNVKADPTKAEETLKARKTAYTRDYLTKGGMRPTNGLGYQGKLKKFVGMSAKHTVEDENRLFDELDKVRAEGGNEAVVALIEKTIAEPQAAAAAQ